MPNLFKVRGLLHKFRERSTAFLSPGKVRPPTITAKLAAQEPLDLRFSDTLFELAKSPGKNLSSPAV